MRHTPWTVRSADWPAPTKMTLALIAKVIGKSSSYFESLASVNFNKRPLFGSGIVSLAAEVSPPLSIREAEGVGKEI